MGRFSDDYLMKRALTFTFEGCDTRAMKATKDGDHAQAKVWDDKSLRYEALIGKKVSAYTAKDEELAQEVVSETHEWLLSRIGQKPHAVSDEG